MSFIPNVVVAWNEHDPYPGALLKLLDTVQGYSEIAGDITCDHHYFNVSAKHGCEQSFDHGLASVQVDVNV
jgi:hypothetical protein